MEIYISKIRVVAGSQDRATKRGMRRPGGRPACPGSPGGPWAQYIRSGPEGAQGVLACAALYLFD